MSARIYLDNSASTPVLPEVVEAMLPYLGGSFGNPSSLHAAGREARQAVENARGYVAAQLGAAPGEIIFTGSGTESNNLAIKGVAFAQRGRGRHVIVSAIEHDSVLGVGRWLVTQGFQVTRLPVDPEGLVDVAALAELIRADTILVSVMHANNEIGTIQPIEEIAALCRSRGVYFHSDACQSFGHLPIDVRRTPVDLLTINAHKIHGPKGVGALFVREGVKLTPGLHGGGQEHGRRSSTENVAGIVGLAAAAERCGRDRKAEAQRLSGLRDRIIDDVLGRIPHAYLNGHRLRRLPNNVNLSFRGWEGEGIRLLLELDAAGIEVSSGSACSSNEAESKPSHVLQALGRNPVEARGALRVTLGRCNTEEEVVRFLAVLPEVLNRLNSIASVRVGG